MSGMLFSRPEAKVYWASDIKSKTTKTLKSIPFKKYEGETYKNVNEYVIQTETS
jgi:hypothetical protein